jgi:hypothetical protein
LPQLKRLSGLYVKVAIDEDGWLSGTGMKPVTINDRVAVSWDYTDIFYTCRNKSLDNPISGGNDILDMIFRSRDRRNTYKLKEFIHKAGLVGIEVI